MVKHTNFKDLNLSNAYLFAAALADEDTCHLILEILLGHSIPKVKVMTEHSILFSSDFRSIRLDVYARDEMEVSYNLEMQNEKEGNLAKRSRYHQAELDVISLKPGDDFSELKPSYILFLCTFDPFGEGLYRYSFEERCRERDIPLGDETQKIFLSTKGTNDHEVTPELIHFLRYVENSSDTYVSEISDPVLAEIHDKIARLKQSRELEAGFMKFEELLQSRERKGMSEGITLGRTEGQALGRIEGQVLGRTEGQEKILTLIQKMSQDGLTPEIPRLGTDPDFFEQMLTKYEM